MRVNVLWCEFELLVGRFVLASWEVLELGLFGRFAAGDVILSLYDWAGLLIIIWRGWLEMCDRLLLLILFVYWYTCNI